MRQRPLDRSEQRGAQGHGIPALPHGPQTESVPEELTAIAAIFPAERTSIIFDCPALMVHMRFGDPGCAVVALSSVAVMFPDPTPSITVMSTVQCADFMIVRCRNHVDCAMCFSAVSGEPWCCVDLASALERSGVAA
jgi:hypothetical protein